MVQFIYIYTRRFLFWYENMQMAYQLNYTVITAKPTRHDVIANCLTFSCIFKDKH